MTTVCWDGERLAADTLYVAGSRKMQGHYEKIHFPGDKAWTVEGKKVIAFGFSGAIGAIAKIKGYLEAGVTHDTAPDVNDNSFTILMVTDQKEVYNWSYGLSAQKEVVNDLFITNGNHAIGSGGIYGLAVMAIKGDAIDAVRAAMKVDIHSGGYIDYWVFGTPSKVTRMQEVTEPDADIAILCTSGD